MFEESGGRSSLVSQVADQSARGLLASARDAQARARRAEADLLVCALQWAVVHPSGDGTADADDAAVFFDAAGVEPIAGAGCPGVAEFAVAELGSELGMSTTAVKRLVGHALELAHRLPRTWRRVLDGEVEPWRARRVAEATIHAHPALTAEAVEWVDAQAAPFINRVGQAQVDRIVDAAITRFHLEVETDADDLVVDHLHVTLGEASARGGCLDISATLPLADALDLDHAVRTGAQELKALGSEEPLGARRARALGHLARLQTSLDLAAASAGAGTGGDDGEQPDAGTGRLPVARRLDLHLHFTADADADGGLDPVGFMENGQRIVLRDHLAAWLGDSCTEVRVLPVLDLGEDLTAPGYVPTPRLRRQVQLRDRTCVFPWCARPARACDLDHVVPYDVSRSSADRPSQTRSSNLAALCRGHHRLKTHSGWRYEVTGPGEYLWTSPHGHRYRSDRHGTVRLEPCTLDRPGSRPHAVPDGAP